MVQLSYDAIVIGAGPAGLTAGLEAAASGARVLILEKRNSEDSAQRFQAVVLDAQSQINLRNLGVSLNCLVPLHQALVFDRHWQVDGHTRYAEQPP
ncbi:MAG: FAD-dependent monooxygenase, partial [Pseudomonadota bacterium]